MTDLPQSFYMEKAKGQGGLRANIWIAVLLTIASGWTLFGLPGSPVHLLRLPEDMPSFGMGIADMYVDTDGTWIIKREHYADRMHRYELHPDGRFEKFRGALRGDRNPEMEGGSIKKDNLMMAEGHIPKVKPSRQYHQKLLEIRRAKVKDAPVNKDTAPVTREQLAIDAEARRTNLKEPYVIVMVYSMDDVSARFILPDHTFYEVLDSVHFRHPDLWLTTDSLKYLHRVKATDAGGKVVIEPLKSVKLGPALKTEFDSKMGLDPTRKLLYILLPNGEVYWYEPQSLKFVEKQQLPGQWEREYAQLGFTPTSKDWPYYPEGSGMALTEHGYRRLMRLLAVVFIAGLIWLGLELTRAWRSTSGQTTAATS
jgi:hypothetical protein